ncbi:MAG: FMN-binding negative transcriptional regulator [Candidatus Sulfotelmatobacter sp.]
MYIPEHFRLRHDGEAVAFMRANPFAILISSTDAGPFATHLPLFVREEAEKVFLRGHVAKANPHWRYLEQQAQCLTIFHGPHAYISPGNYTAQESVPTWNYAAVHVYGSARLFSSDQDVHQMLHELMETFEPAYRLQWEQLSQKYRENMLRQIVGFEIVATKIEGKFKLSQNRTRQDQANVITSLEKAEDSAVSGVARMMKEQRLGKVEGDEESE